MTKWPGASRPTTLVLIIAAQALSTAFFLWDSLSDTLTMGLAGFADIHNVIELAAVVSLVVAIVLESRLLMAMLRRESQLERSMSVAAGALQDVIDVYFQQWSLTPSEQDVATFTIKGCSISEIAALRGSASGTVKSHLNAIYRKAGVTGRGGLLALLIEDLLSDPLIDVADPAAACHR